MQLFVALHAVKINNFCIKNSNREYLKNISIFFIGSSNSTRFARLMQNKKDFDSKRFRWFTAKNCRAANFVCAIDKTNAILFGYTINYKGICNKCKG